MVQPKKNRCALRRLSCGCGASVCLIRGQHESRDCKRRVCNRRPASLGSAGAVVAMEQAVRSVDVQLAERSYRVVIGPRLLDGIGNFLKKESFRPACAVITDSNVAQLY